MKLRTDRESRIFTPAELEEVKRRMNGEKKDHKIWYRAKPRIIELLEIWFPQKKKLKKLVEKKVNR